MRAHLKILTQLGHTPEFYVDIEKSQDVLNYTELLTMFGAEELENQLLNDQGAFLVPVPYFISLLLLLRFPSFCFVPCFDFAWEISYILLCCYTQFCCTHTHTHSIYTHTHIVAVHW